MQRTITALAVACAALTTSVAIVRADAVFDIEDRPLTSEGKPRASTKHKIFVAGQKMRLEFDGKSQVASQINAQSGGVKGKQGKPSKAIVIYRGDQETLYQVRPTEKRYIQVRKSEIDDQVKAAQAQIEAVISQLPPEQRDRARQALGQMAGGGGAKQGTPKTNEVVKKVDESKTISGYTCTRVDIFENGAKVREMWVTPPEKVAGANEALAAFQGLSKFFESVTAMLGPMAQDINMLDRQAQYGGVPVLMRRFEGGKAVEEIQLTRSATEKVDGKSFEPPSGYVAQNLSDLARSRGASGR